MSAIVTNKSEAFSFILNEGTDSSGNMITKNTALPTVKHNADLTKVLALQTAFATIAEAPVYVTKRTVVNILSE